MAKIAALQPLVGRWSTTITMLSPEKVAGEVYGAIDTYRWLPGEHILIHEVEARMGKDTTHSIEVYSESDGKIVSRNFAGSGEISDYAATMSRGKWQVTGKSERFASTSITADAIEGLWQLKGDGGWREWMTVKLVRVG